MPIKINSASGGSVTLDVPATASTYTHTLPAETGTIITTATGSGINASALSVGTLPKTRFPIGCILQVVNTNSSYNSTLSGSFDQTIASVTITPSSTSSKIFLLADVSCYNTSSGDYSFGFKFLRNSTIILQHSERMYSASGTATFIPTSMSYLDSPATTSAITYNWNMTGANRGSSQPNRNGGGILLTAFEVSA